MKYILVILFLIGCNTEKKPELKKYYVVIEIKELPILGGDYEDSKKIDTINVENDSIAYWKGVIAYTASLRTDNLLKKQGIKNAPYYATGFEVLNEYGNDISGNLSETLKAQAKKFIEEKSVQ
jgi:hypothetical protein